MEIVYFYIICIFSIILAVIGLAKVPMASVFSLIISITVVLSELLNGSLSGADLTFGIVTVLICAMSLIVKRD